MTCCSGFQPALLTAVYQSLLRSWYGKNRKGARTDTDFLMAKRSSSEAHYFIFYTNEEVVRANISFHLSVLVRSRYHRHQLFTKRTWRSGINLKTPVGLMLVWNALSSKTWSFLSTYGRQLSLTAQTFNCQVQSVANKSENPSSPQSSSLRNAGLPPSQFSNISETCYCPWPRLCWLQCRICILAMAQHFGVFSVIQSRDTFCLFTKTFFYCW